MFFVQICTKVCADLSQAETKQTNSVLNVSSEVNISAFPLLICTCKIQHLINEWIIKGIEQSSPSDWVVTLTMSEAGPGPYRLIAKTRTMYSVNLLSPSIL